MNNQNITIKCYKDLEKVIINYDKQILNNMPALAKTILKDLVNNYNNRIENYHTYQDKIDLLFPSDLSEEYLLANKVIKDNLGFNGFIIDIQEFLKENDLTQQYFNDNIKKSIETLKNIEISVIQGNEEDNLTMNFGIISNAIISRKTNNKEYLYYEISTVLETILYDSIPKKPSKELLEALKEVADYENGKVQLKSFNNVEELMKSLEADDD